MNGKIRGLLLGLPLLALVAAVSAPLVFGTAIWVGVVIFFATAPIAVGLIALMDTFKGDEEARHVVPARHEPRHEGRS
ncbi:hypothetical protein OCH239_01265 [Roseivivax halodurans JCM 10272]|uniref:Uncharacterized protein n=1 Tax=Roseivivax halodurans JCM 10272 TaxID=1449350 RepID=X7ENH0_9RHOB|nr:hypothetical protein [Roseivivax halodurans]ETX16718.1 hypothetical protein OCH239_01265 [Roseivivax halodurans JCM 10272]